MRIDASTMKSSALPVALICLVILAIWYVATIPMNAVDATAAAAALDQAFGKVITGLVPWACSAM